jgi:hypothetical protein
MGDIDKERKYIKTLIYLNLQKKEISELMAKPISEKIYKLKLINKDIINGYSDEQMNKEIMSFLNNQNKKTSEFNEQDINNIIYNIMKNKNKNKNKKESIVEELALDFLFPEELKVNDIEFPSNFYIITEEKFNKIFENNLTDFKTYDAYLGEDGIFMWIEGDMITNEGNEKKEETKDYNKVMYFIEENNNINDLKINKIFLYKNDDFKEQLDGIIKEGKTKYFDNRNVIKDDLGCYNMINDGKIIGKYINVIKESQEDKGKEVNNEIQNSIKEINESKRIENEIKRIKEKEELNQMFLPYLLICFSKIEKFKKGLEQNKEGILRLLLEIIKSVDNKKKKDFGDNLIKFEKEFKKKELIHKFSYPYDNKTEVFKNLIEMLLNEFHQEIYIENKENPRKKFDDFKNSTFIFDLFFGLKKINKRESFFNTIELNTDGTGNQEVKIEDLLIHYKFKQEDLVLYFPNVLILLINDQGKLLKLPLEFNLEYDKKEINIYKLKSCLQMSSENFFSFLKKDKNQDFFKISFDYNKDDKLIPTYENSNIEEINENLSQYYNICFYEIDVENINNNDNNTEVENENNNNFNNQNVNNN